MWPVLPGILPIATGSHIRPSAKAIPILSRTSIGAMIQAKLCRGDHAPSEGLWAPLSHTLVSLTWSGILSDSIRRNRTLSGDQLIKEQLTKAFARGSEC